MGLIGVQIIQLAALGFLKRRIILDIGDIEAGEVAMAWNAWQGIWG
jgi:hypothetical protein